MISCDFPILKRQNLLLGILLIYQMMFLQRLHYKDTKSLCEPIFWFSNHIFHITNIHVHVHVASQNIILFWANASGDFLCLWNQVLNYLFNFWKTWTSSNISLSSSTFLFLTADFDNLFVSVDLLWCNGGWKLSFVSILPLKFTVFSTRPTVT